jgi:transmembrane 9 superfamily protein 2/4
MILFVLFAISSAFYIPGVAPTDYEAGEVVKMKVNNLDSTRNLPYEYYSLPFCRPDKIEGDVENLGEILTGDRIENSPYEIYARLETNCQVLCEPRLYTDKELKHFASKIKDFYQVNMIVDNIPATTSHYLDDGQVIYEKGFPLGFIGSRNMVSNYARPGVSYINNHIVIKLAYHQSDKGNRIVGFEIDPYSIKHEWYDQELLTCQDRQHLSKSLPAQAVDGQEVLLEEDRKITWTYDVVWEESDVPWISRWDSYLKMTNSEIHWFSIINSCVIVLFLTAFVAMIMVRTLHKDLQTYEEQALSPMEQQEETGWKLVHGDVFRPPTRGSCFSVVIGTGVQLLCMVLFTMVFAILGFLSPSNRGGLMTALLMLFAFMGVVAGYVSTRVYTLFQLTSWKTNTLMTAIGFPGIVFAVFFLLNLLIWQDGSSGAVPFATLVALLVLWFGISVPLVYAGAHLAIRKDPIQPPLKVNAFPRLIPPSTDWFTNSEFSVLVGGVLPFAAAFIEIFFIMSSIWQHQFYYVFGFLFLVFVILCVTCAEISIVMCYFQLCHGNHHWWWRSLLTSGSSALYLFLYSVFYFATRLEITDSIMATIYFGYMLLTSLTFFLCTGTVGFVSTYWFVDKIYSSVKID